MKLHFHKILTLLSILIASLVLAQDRGIPPKPTGVIMPVYDAVDVLSPEQEAQLNQKIIAFHERSSSEILIVLTDTTHGEDPNFLATMWGEKWGIGEKEQDNGLVLLVAFQDKRLSIQPGRGVEQYITAAEAGQIIDYVIKPKIKKQPYEALNEATDYIISALEGKYKAPKKHKKDKDEGFGSLLIIGFIVLVIIIIASKNNRGGGGFTINGGGFFPGNFGGGFGGGRSSGSDSGFGGFGGGGSFGGGGASGSWD